MSSQMQANEVRPASDNTPSEETPWQREQRRKSEWDSLLHDYVKQHPDLAPDAVAAIVVRDHPGYADEAAQWQAAHKAHREWCIDQFNRRAGIYADCRLESFRPHGTAADQTRQRSLLKRLRSMLPAEGRRLETSDLGRSIKAGQNILFLGKCGTGKDHLMHGLLWRVCLAVKYELHNGATLRTQLKDAATSNERTESTIIDSVCKPLLLGISDLVPNNGKPLSDFQADCLYQIVERRTIERRPIWATLNLPVDGTMDKEGDERLTPPVWDRLRHGALIVACNWQCFRKPAEIIGT